MLLLLGTLAFAQNNTLKGKKFKTKITESCKKTTTGGYMIYTHSQYEFAKDSVMIVYHLKKSDRPNEEIHCNTYKYIVKKDIVLIKKHDISPQRIDSLKIVPGGLLGKINGKPIALSYKP